jgi:hypothetical protein
VDESLFTLFVIAVGAVFYAIAPVVFDETKVFTRQHPPEALRMNYVMHSAKSWCNQNRRPLVERWISLQIFQIAMAGVAEAIFGPAGRTNLLHQTRFLVSDAGAAYVGKLEEVPLRQFAAWKQRS